MAHFDNDSGLGEDSNNFFGCSSMVLHHQMYNNFPWPDRAALMTAVSPSYKKDIEQHSFIL
jgi:hypothetical protein